MFLSSMVFKYICRRKIIRTELMLKFCLSVAPSKIKACLRSSRREVGARIRALVMLLKVHQEQNLKLKVYNLSYLARKTTQEKEWYSANANKRSEEITPRDIYSVMN